MINGTRVTVRTVLASLAEGAKIKEILADFPTIPGRKRVGRHRVCRGVLRRKGYSAIVTEIRRSEARGTKPPVIYSDPNISPHAISSNDSAMGNGQWCVILGTR